MSKAAPSRRSRPNPVRDLLAHKDVIYLDGGLATELQARGANIDGPLWSGKALTDNSDTIRQIHLDYYKAGANIATTAIYQVTVKGLEDADGTREEAIELLKKSVDLAKEARLLYETGSGLGGGLVAGSIGPYGAYLADGSEYRGDYNLPSKDMIGFHRTRLRTLLESGVDVLAIETIPSFRETHALLSLLESFPRATAWFSFTAKDSKHISDGTPFEKVLRSVNRSRQVVAVGVNCIAMDQVTSVLEEMGKHTELPLIVYPNSGGVYDGRTHSWSGERHSRDQLTHAVREWRKLGARIIGGCCQTCPDDIRAIVAAFEPAKRVRGMSIKELVQHGAEKLRGGEHGKTG